MVTRRAFLSSTAVAGFAGALSSAVQAAAVDTKALSSATALKTYHVPGTDLVVSRLAFGCAMLGLDPKDWVARNVTDFAARTAPLIETAYEQGITLFDLADTYGNGQAEVALGAVIKRRPEMRRKIVIQTKCGMVMPTVDVIDNSRDYIVQAAQGSLKRLGVDHIDILLLHFRDSLAAPEEVAEAFDRLHGSGTVRYFGVSNHSPYQMELLRKVVRQPLIINQIQLGLGHWDVPAPSYKSRLTHGPEGAAVVDYCHAQGIQVQAYSPLQATDSAGRAVNLLKADPDAPAAVQKLTKTLAQVAESRRTNPAVILLAWLLRHPAGIVPIIGAIKPEHVIENCAADRIQLSREEWYALLNAAADMQSARTA